MQKARPLGITVLAWVIIVNSTVAILPLFQSIPTNIQKFATIFALSPEDMIIGAGHLLKIDFALSALGCYIFFLLGVLWGVGLLKLNNVSRIVTILISLLMAVGIIISGHLNYRGYGEPAQLYGPSLWFIFTLASFCVHLAYIYFFTRPKIKDQFK